MSGILAMFTAGGSGSGGGSSGHLDTQTITTGTDGTAFFSNRERGFRLGVFGSLSDGVSYIYSLEITDLYYYEGGGSGASYKLVIPGSTNGGWTTLTIGSTSLSRAAATFTGDTWTWATAHTVANQAFGSENSIQVVFFD